MGQRRFYRSDQEWIDIVEQLKQTRCPHCQARGILNRHGTLHGFEAMREFILRELDRVELAHNTFTPAAINLVVNSADGVLRRARNLCVGCLIEAVRSGKKTIDIDNVNRVLMQPHWHKDVELKDYQLPGSH
ncbi:MAG: hypothetical protein U0792_15965 [Gemmataceae bacterium]